MSGDVIKVEVEGVSSLLQHKYTFRDERAVHGKRRSGAQDHTEEWKASLFKEPRIGIYQPGLHLEAALVKAAANFQIPGRGKKTYQQLFRSAVFVSPEKIPLRKQEPDRIHKSRVIVARAAVERYRPEFVAGWRLQFELTVLDDQIPREIVKDILEYAGAFCGIGDWRPRYGRFRVLTFG